MTPKLIALDLDETTLNRDSRLSAADRAAMERAIAKGVEIVVATGRPFGSVPQEIRTFPGIRYAITGNGAAVHDLGNGQALQRYLLPKEAVEKILDLTWGENLTYEAFIQGIAYAQADYITAPERFLADAQTKVYIQSTRHPVADITAFIRHHEAELDSLDLVVGDMDTKRRMMERVQQAGEIYITTSVPRLVELSHAQGGKHRGLQFLAERLGIDQKDTAAFGNGDNDAEMLRWAGTGVAVRNASEGCLAAADAVTDAYWESGVAQAFATLFGI